MSGQTFDIMNLFIAILAFALAGFTAYWQHRKVDKLSIAVLDFGVHGAQDQTIVRITFSLANTGSMPAIVSSIYYKFPIGQGEHFEVGCSAPSKGRIQPILVGAGELAHATAFFAISNDDMPAMDINDRGSSFASDYPGKIHLDMISGRGTVVARELEGFAAARHGERGGVSCARPRYNTAVLLPKPDSDKSYPYGL